MLGGNLRESGSEFQRTLLEYTRLDLKMSVLGIGILSFPECNWFRENLAISEGGTFPDKISFLFCLFVLFFCIRTPLL